MSNTDTYQNTVALPIGEVARLLGCSIGTVRNWDKAGTIKSFRTPGGQRRFLLTEVTRVLATTERVAS